ncbi:hypothetical protein DFJ74DRAFT_666455 [Hyaloraphidium curvatum]|nr:hypothetical protein DFJ74DRAFT_666455 [Hyaloraphidium curvatum]
MWRGRWPCRWTTTANPPPQASTSPLPGRISLTVGVRPGPCPSFYAASQATAQCTTLMQGGYPTRTWCRPGNTMSITSDGFYGWIDSGPVPDALKQNGFNYELWFSNTTQTCDLPPRNGLSVVAASMLLNNATRPVPAGCRTPLLNGRMCRQSPFGPTGQALSIILGPAARSYVESCGRMGTSPLRVQSGNKKTTARKKTTSARKKTTTRKKVVTTKRRS